MDVFINDNPRPVGSAEQTQTVDQLLASLRAADPDCLVVGVSLDGEPLAGRQIDEIRGKSLAGPGRLDLQTASARRLAAQTLGQVADMLEQNRQQQSAVGELIAAGKNAKAMELLTACFSTWNGAEQALRQASTLVGLELDNPLPGGAHPAELIDKLGEYLRQVKQQLEIRDFLAVGDLVEYEMPAITDGWQRMLNSLQQSLLA